MFRITNGEGFQITLPNNWTVSVQFGSPHYGTNRWTKENPRHHSHWEASTAEVAVSHKDRKEWFKLNDRDDINGWTTVQEFLDILEQVKTLPDTPDPYPLPVNFLARV